MQSSSGARREWGDAVIIQVSNRLRMRECDIPAKAATPRAGEATEHGVQWVQWVAGNNDANGSGVRQEWQRHQAEAEMDIISWIDDNIKELLNVEGIKDSMKVEGRRGENCTRDKQTVNSEILIQYDDKHNQIYFLTSSFVLSSIVFHPPPLLLITIALHHVTVIFIPCQYDHHKSHLHLSDPCAQTSLSAHCLHNRASPTCLACTMVSLAHPSDPCAHNHPILSTQHSTLPHAMLSTCLTSLLPWTLLLHCIHLPPWSSHPLLRYHLPSRHVVCSYMS